MFSQRRRARLLPSAVSCQIALVAVLAVVARLVSAPSVLAQSSSCGNAILDPTEECDPPGSAVCPPALFSTDPQLCNMDCSCPGVCSGFAFLVGTDGKVGNGGSVDGGIGANAAGGLIRLGKEVFVDDGGTVAADKAKLGSGTSVFDVFANTLQKGADVTIRGVQGTPALPLTDPFCSIPTFTCGGADVIVSAGSSTGPLAPGTYGNVLLADGATLTLAPGTFAFCSIKAGRDTTIETTGATQSTIDVVGTIRLLTQAFLGSAAGTPTPNINVAGALVRISQNSVIEGALRAPNALVRIGRSGTVTGSFCSASSGSDKGISLICAPQGTRCKTHGLDGDVCCECNDLECRSFGTRPDCVSFCKDHMGVRNYLSGPKNWHCTEGAS